MVMAYLARFGWLVLLSAGATWSRPWRGVRDMAAVDGAGPLRTALYVVWPLGWPLLAGAAVLVLVLSLTEVPATVLISPLRPRPIVPMLMTWVHTLESDPMIEASLLLMAVVLALATAAAGMMWAGKRGWRIEDGGSRRGVAPPAILYLLSSLLVLTATGCGDSTAPDEVWGETGTAPGQVVYPRAIAYSPGDDTFFVIDRVARVQHLDRKGRPLNEWQMPDWQNGKPVGASVGPDGNLYVPDTHYHRVMVYSPKGQLVRRWGKLGRGDGEFIFPTDVAFEDKGGGRFNVFVSEYGENDRVQVFDQTGTRLYQFGHFGNGEGQFSRPQSVVIDKGLVYVTDSCNHRLVVFKTDGTFVRNMGGVGSELGQFRFPYGLDIDGDGRLVVCEFGNNRIQRVDKETGRGLGAWGSAGREPGQLAYPWGVAVDKHDRVVAVDAGNNRLQVFEF
jgi:DNA-binding beta-propeller fold protein YncE